MTEAVLLIAKYQAWVYVLLGLLSFVYVRSLWQARRLSSQTHFGLEKEAALQKQNSAIGVLLILVALAVGVRFIEGYVAPTLDRAKPTPDPRARPTVLPSPTPVGSGSGPLVLDTSGCGNPKATLLEPQPNARISGSFEARGTANIDNFAFYKFELSGRGTNGAWVPLHVGRAPVVDGSLGTFDSSVYDAGEYAFRLVVTDSAGNFPPPCMVPVTIVPMGGTPAP